MTELPHEGAGRNRWLKGLAAAGWTFLVIMGTAAVGLIGGLAYGFWETSQMPRGSSNDDFFVSLAGLVGTVIYAAIGFVGGLAVGLLVLAMKGIVGLARKIVRGWEEGSTTRLR